MESLRIIFGRRVRSFRESRGWSQEQLGRAAGLGGKYVGIIERGQKNASFEAIEKLAKALEVESFEFFVPINRRADSVRKRTAALVRDAGQIDQHSIADFLKSLDAALQKLETGRSSS